MIKVTFVMIKTVALGFFIAVERRVPSIENHNHNELRLPSTEKTQE